MTDNNAFKKKIRNRMKLTSQGRTPETYTQARQNILNNEKHFQKIQESVLENLKDFLPKLSTLKKVL